MEHLQTAATAASAASGAIGAAKGAAASGLIWPFVGGAIAAAAGFAFAWPHTKREGISRIAVTITTSVLCGEAFTAWAYAQSWLDFLPHTHKTELLLTVIAGLPAWWVLGWLFNTLKNRAGKDFPQIADEFRGKS